MWSSCTTHVLVSEPTPPKASIDHQTFTNGAHVQREAGPCMRSQTLNRTARLECARPLVPFRQKSDLQSSCAINRLDIIMSNLQHLSVVLERLSRATWHEEQKQKLQPAKSWILIAHNTTASHASTEPLPNKSPTLHIDARLPLRTLASHSSNSSTCSLSKRARYSATIKSAMPCPTASWSKQTYLQPSTPSATP